MLKLLDKFINVLFPKEISTLKLETMSCEQMIEELRPSVGFPNEANDVISIFLYKDRKTKELIHEIKYNRNKILLEKAGKIMADKIIGNFEEKLVFGSYKICLVPIPTSTSREDLRGYNPPEDLAHEIAKSFPESFVVAPILKKIKETKRQAMLSQFERKTNLLNAFIAESKCESPIAIIIDDISTTGATIAEAKRALKESGIEVVGAIVLAH